MAGEINKTTASTIRDNTNQSFDQLRAETERILRDGKVTNDEVKTLERLRDTVMPLFVNDLKALEAKIAREIQEDKRMKDPALQDDGARKGRGDLWDHADQGNLSLLRGAEYQLGLAFEKTIHALKILSADQKPPDDEVKNLKSLAALLAKGPPKGEDLQTIYNALAAKREASEAERERASNARTAMAGIGWANGADFQGQEAVVWGPKEQPNVSWLDKSYDPKKLR